jgi:hypothetical protein
MYIKKFKKPNRNARKILKIEKINKKSLEIPFRNWGSYTVDHFLEYHMNLHPLLS